MGRIISLLNIIGFSLLSYAGHTQESDTIKTLSPTQFIEWIRQYHPVAKQAALMVENAQAGLQAARGAFDPVIYYNSDEKQWDEKTYFQYNNASLKIPTWYGIEVMAGIENNSGDFTNPEFSLGKTSYAGLSVPLLKNLIIDQRRTVLAQSKIFIDQSISEQRNYINDLIFEGLQVYWQWVADYQRYLIIKDALKANNDRYGLIKLTVEQGDRAGVDSTEALTQLLQFQFAENEAYMSFINTGYRLSTYLWSQQSQPILLLPEVKPAILPEQMNVFAQPVLPLSDVLTAASENHPKLKVYDSKLDILALEQKLKFQSLLPTVNLKYNALSENYQFLNDWSKNFFENNYKFGVEIGMPLFLRQARGNYKSAKLKIQSTGLEQNLLKIEIENKVKAYYNEQVNLLEQIKINERAFDAYKKVFDVELQKFSLGESTLFLVNSRELKFLDSRQKLAELKAKYFKSAYGVEWAAGLLQ